LILSDEEEVWRRTQQVVEGAEGLRVVPGEMIGLVHAKY
jgi:hypothetical protein